MFQPAQRRLPPVDYVSIVRSLYADRRSMLYGMLCAAIAAGASALGSGSIALYVIAALFVIVGLLRNADMKAFEMAPLGAEDVQGAEYWEFRITVGAVATAALHGFWCFFSLAVVDDGYAAFSSAVVTVASVVGIANRNFALDRLVTLQLLFVTVPFGIGLFLRGDVFHAAIALLLILFMAGVRRMAANLREIYLGAVHGRVQASHLAGQLDTALSTMPHGLCMLDDEGRVGVVNSRVQEMLPALSAERSVGRPIGQVLLEARRNGLLSKDIARLLADALKRGLGQRHLVIPLAYGRQCEISVSSREGRTVIMFEDITERLRASERIEFMARFDGLTKLPNRSYFSEQVETDLAAKRDAQSRDSVMMMMVDLDDFKHVNDTFGHPVGDALLIEAADRIRRTVGTLGLVARFGGDEFIVFQSGEITRSGMEELASALLLALREPFQIMGHSLKTNASLGIVLTEAHEDLATILTRADLALYKAKGDGKGRWALFHDVMDTEYRTRQRLKTDLRAAIDNDELSLVFQPIVDIRDRRIIGCEALARWQHKELGRIPPTVFIPIAEEIGAISDISRWVLRTATRECQQWPEPLRISVNLSATDFRSNDVAAMVQQGLSESGLDPTRLEVEITESSLIEEKEAVSKALNSLRQQGVGVALDDFGTGYSSLSYLHELPFTKLKIDRSFVIDVTTNPRSLKLLSNIARLSKDLDMKVTVEGIETEEQLSVIAACRDVDQAQGYLFGAPLPKREVSELISRVLPSKSEPRRLKA